MAPETCVKVNKLCIRSHESAVLNFLKAQIGFKKGDCGWQLTQTDAGTRFLGLAAALLSVDYWVASEALNRLLRETAEDLRLVPTSYQLKVLLKSLEYKLSQSGFVEKILGWSSNISLVIDVAPSFTSASPSQELLVELVKALSDISRVGQAKGLQIKAPVDQAAWIIAFIEWSIGLAPSVIIENDTCIHIEPMSVITIRLLLSSSLVQQAGFEITTLEDIKSIRVLTKDLPGSHETVRGMVPMRVFAERLTLDLFGHRKTLSFRAFSEALPYGCALVLNFLQVCERWDHVDGKQKSDPGFSNCTATWGSAFPSDRTVASTIVAFLGTESPIQLPKQLDGFLIENLRLVAAFKDVQCQDCECVKCSHIPSAQTLCKFDEFIDKIAICTLVVLLLSLLESSDPEGPWLYFGGYRWFGSLLSGIPWGGFDAQEFIDPIRKILRGDTKVGYSRPTLLQALFQLLGHELYDLEDIWLMSSFRGQAVYPRLFGTMSIEGKGILSMTCVPGALMWEGELYDYARGPKHRMEEAPLFTARSDRRGSETTNCEINAPVDIYSDYKISWQVSKGDKYLTVGIWCPSIPEVSQRCPSASIIGALGSLFVNCIHDHSSKVIRTTSDLRITTPKQPVPYSESEKLIGVVPCAQNSAIRFFTLGAGKNGVIRGDACLDCCIQCCAIAGLDFVLC
ncbi:hypothetical protein N7471_003169 [Penicillium samsonianum]|uniref:uncharacterized protein n=1 Tax=Penicillium samsonianum TaxID=1882272 RepID=UPI00254803DC|nr:uncharacterized protein N7471_003169 [Penicillium samsonianum]KAJ6143716.1 hypothetical protein N7471_003169 [Penicillium samsonianum]